MRIDRFELFLCRLPLVHFFETSFGRTYDRTFVLARMEGDGHEGWGEAVAEGHPYYSGETTETVWHIVTEFLAPLVRRAGVRAPARGVCGDEAGAHAQHGQGPARDDGLGSLREDPGPAAGLGPGRHAAADLLRRVDRHPGLATTSCWRRSAKERAAGYQRIKIKIKPGWDVEAVERIRSRFGDIPLMVDANAAYKLDDGPHLARARSATT